MTYQNPVVPGFYPDPSAIRVGDTYYLVNSSFNYFPGVPLFESHDLVNWTQIGHVLTRPSQLPLGGSNTSGGIYAPTLRYHDGRFYMVTTNVDHNGNFYVYTDDIHGEWSDPIPVEQGGIDPSLYFEGDKTYFMSNGDDDAGNHGITQCEIDIATGKKLTPSKVIWTGAGGRYLEGPHLYKADGRYYLLASEGGTEYGHMMVYARGDAPFGPFVNYAHNPVLTNRNLGGYQIQGTGHADLVDDGHGHWFLIHLAFRQLDRWIQQHTMGRETYLTPVTFDQDGWFTAGDHGTTRATMTAPGLENVQQHSPLVPLSFHNTTIGREWVTLREPDNDRYCFDQTVLAMRPNQALLEETQVSPTALFMRQRAFFSTVQVTVDVPANAAGLTAYMTESQHYDAIVERVGDQVKVARRLRVGPATTLDHVQLLPAGPVTLSLETTNYTYHFFAEAQGKRYDLGEAQAQYLSSELAGNFTGVMLGLFTEQTDAPDADWITFTDFSLTFPKEDDAQ
ncbi:glycoside hydrolase family 43 protein [Lacticaseibacillus parakribbianus]|uniref:glycoside hydrolase family 43 protein n=1 Tax=Lacticaseibacillus parakribbianus TaxID=2970927 RepID=UPI0021CB0A2B|nr:glycoside hydrolase family 43 protein [Lacticaseibacillus parakribbianus]